MTETSAAAPGVEEFPPPAPVAHQKGTPPPKDILLDVRDLRTYFHVMDGLVRAVDGVSFSLGRGKTLGIVGESGSGKSVTALTVMRLLDIPPAEIASGEIWFDGQEILSMPIDDMRKLRGKDMAMIFQEPLTSLNPVFTIGDQIAEQVQLHLKVSKKESWDRAIEALSMVGIPSPERRVKQYPHEMSGGMRQRVMIAMALSCEPKLIVADEPTTALDVTIQAQILELMKSLRERNKMAIMLITHDLGVVAEMADDVVVMYAGKVVERADVDTVYSAPHHPYTQGLLASIPRLGEKRERLEVIQGVVPNPLNLPNGCLFKRRCPHAMPVCDNPPPLRDVSAGLTPIGTPPHLSRCWLTPDGGPPEIGVDATPEAAAEAVASLSVE